MSYKAQGAPQAPRPLSRKFVVTTYFMDGTKGDSAPITDRYICGGRIRMEAQNLATAKAQANCEEGITLIRDDGSMIVIPSHQVKFCTIQELAP